LWTLITGLIVGFLATLLTPGPSPGGFLITMIHSGHVPAAPGRLA